MEIKKVKKELIPKYEAEIIVPKKNWKNTQRQSQ